ncbi:MAG: hypothetical protein Tsb0026_18260 [Sulfuricaulis sp.]
MIRSGTAIHIDIFTMTPKTRDEFLDLVDQLIFMLNVVNKQGLPG